MTNPPAPGPRSDDEDHDATSAGLTAAWHECLDWAQRGDSKPLAALLRGENSLQDDRHVRDFLADVLESKFKRPRGKPVQRPEKTFALDSRGKVHFIDKRDLRQIEIKKWIADHKATLGKRVYEAAAECFEMDIESLIVTVRRSSKARKRPRST